MRSSLLFHVSGKKSDSFFRVVKLFSLLFIFHASGNNANAAWCTGSCSTGSGFNQQQNAGVLVPGTNRQLATITTSSSAGTEHKIFYTFAATAGRTYVFDFCDMGIDGLTDNKIYLYDGPCSTGNFVAQGSDWMCNHNDYLEWTCITSGTYYVLTTYSGCGGNFSTGQTNRLGYYYLDKGGCSSGNFFDPGGSGGGGTSQGHGNFSYFRDIDDIVRTYTPTAGYAYQVTFSNFNTQAGQDLLYVYNGNSIAAPQVAGSPFSGNTLPNGGATITSTAADGSLTFRFATNSDFTVNNGWIASMSVTGTPASNPVINGAALTCAAPTTTLSINSPVGGTTYTWTGPVSGSGTSLANATAGNYTVTATSSGGCVSTGTYTLSPPPALPTVTISPVTGTVITCVNTSIALNGSTNAATPVYAWSGSGSGATSSINATGAGTYTLTVTDNATGCSNSANQVITANTTAPNISIVPPSTLTCTTTSIVIDGNSSTGGVTYAWTGPVTGTSDNLTTSTPGNYTLTVTNPANGCTSNSSVTVNQNTTAPNVSIVPPSTITCSTPSIIIDGNSSTGGVTYAWTGPVTGSSDNLSTSTAGNYTLTVTNPTNGCTSNSSVTVNANTTAPNVSIVPPSTLTCTTTSIVIDGNSSTGGVTYAWTGPVTGSSDNLTTSTSGNYTLTVTNPANGCTSNSSVTVNQNTTAPNVSIAPPSTLTCTATSIIINGNSSTGGVTYAWTGPVTGSSDDLSTSTPGSYTLTVTNPANGCTSNSSVTVNQNTTQPNVSIVPPSTITCAVPSVTIDGSSSTGGATYAWTGPTTGTSDDLNTSTAGSYTLTVTDPANGCTNSSSVTVNSNTTQPDVTVDPASDITCGSPTSLLSGSSLTANATYAWTDGSSNPAGTTPTQSSTSVTSGGTYTLTVTDPANGCTNSGTVTIAANASLPDISVNPASDLTCTSTTTTISGSSTLGNATFAWTDASSNPAGTTPTSNTTDVTSPGTYTLTVTDPSNGCSSAQIVTVVADTAAPVVSISSTSTSIDCSTNATVTLTGNASGASLSWNGPSGAISGNPITVSTAGLYTVTATGTTNGCTSSASITLVGDNVPPTVVFAGNTDVCPGDIATLTASGGSSYLWSTGDNTAGISITTNSDQYYTVTVTNAFGCTATDSVLVDVNDAALLLNANNDSTSIETVQVATVVVTQNDLGNPGSVTIISGPANGVATTSGNTISYDPNSGFVGTDTLYYLVCDANCSGFCDTAMLVIRVTAEVVVRVPGGFSPNGDGINDNFVITGLDKYPENELYIYNRWGELVFSATPYQNDWNGLSNNPSLRIYGTEVIDGTYFYVLILEPGTEALRGSLEMKRR